MTVPFDPVAQRTDLERQLALLEPVRQHLTVEITPRSLILDGEWRGPAADAAAGLVTELDRRLTHAADAVDDFVRTVRGHLGGLP